jgi:hypothetical protein
MIFKWKKAQFTNAIDLLIHLIKIDEEKFPFYLFPHSHFFYIRVALQDRLKRELTAKEERQIRYFLYKDYKHFKKDKVENRVD